MCSSAGRGNEVLRGRGVRWEVEEERLRLASRLGDSIAGLNGFVDGSDNGRRKDIVRDRLSGAGLSSFGRGSGGTRGFLTSGSLNSSFPFLSDAKYSSPRPNTTCRVGKSRSDPSVGKSHSFRSGGRSYPSKES
jgi:hypothetical protein